MKRKIGKKGVFFSTDALIALIVIFIVILAVYPLAKNKRDDSEASSDILKILSSVKIGEIDNAYAKELISQGKIKDTNKSVLEQIGDFYVNNEPEAGTLAQSVLDSLDIDKNIGIWYGDEIIASVSSSPYETSEDVNLDRQVISGIEKGKDLKGYSSRAYLSRANGVNYFYFGGYIGDGNITARIDLPGEPAEARIEIAINKDFDLYINDIFSGHYENSSSPTTPAIYNINAYTGNFNSGINTARFSGQNLYIAGGYVRITHNNSEYGLEKKRFIPGIKGIINIYDSFYIPGSLNSLSVFLHYKSDYKTVFNIENKTVYNSSSTGENSVTIDNSALSSLLNYSKMSRKTIPYRFVLANVSYIANITKNIDVFSVSDLSGSMGDCAIYSSAPYCTYDCCRADGSRCQGQSCLYPGTCSSQECGVCPLNKPLDKNYLIENRNVCNKTKLDLAKESNIAFIDSVLNNSVNRVGLKAYQTTYMPGLSHSLSNNSVSLKSKISSWVAIGNTCICCGINQAKSDLVANSTSDKSRVMVVMSDGQANVGCLEQNTGNAKQDAINAACSAYASNITVYAVGFGSDADAATLQGIANCGGGKYYFGNVSEIVEIYRQIAQNIIEASYHEQTISSSGNLSTILYPDSYIKMNYTSDLIPYGLEFTAETDIFGNNTSEGSFTVPQDSEALEANVISYSGARWTDNVYVFNNTWQSIFSLSDYGNFYTLLGDPYAVNIPLKYLKKGDNKIKVTTGINPGNSTNGSAFNKIIYTLIKPAQGYSKISPVASGCKWHIEFEDSTSIVMNIPSAYSGTKVCSYNSTLVSYNDNDAINNAVFSLLSSFDLNSNHKVETKFSEQDLEISSNEVSGIPYKWATEVQVRTWN